MACKVSLGGGVDLNLSDYVPWLAFGFMFGTMLWGVVFCFRALSRSVAIGAGFYDV